MNHSRPAISILVPIYNTEQYLKQCLESISRQTFQDIEVLCLNDGSTDESAEIIHEFTSADKRFIEITKKNTGYGNTMNIGIRSAKGKYIGIVESDDFIEPDMYEALFNIAEEEQVDFVKTGYYAYLNGEKKYMPMSGKFPFGKAINPKDYPMIFGIHPSVWSSLYKRDFLIDNDVFFLETPGASFQDIGFSFRAFSAAERVYLLDKGYLDYRMDNNASSINSQDKMYCVFDEMDAIYRYIEGEFSDDKRENLEKIADWIAFREYDWNLRRIDPIFRSIFIEYAGERLQKIDKKRIDTSMWPDEEQEGITVFQNKDRRRGYLRDSIYRDVGKWTDDDRIRNFISVIHSSCGIHIYGAGIIGKRVLRCIKHHDEERKIKDFVVSVGDENNTVMGVTVRDVGSLSKEELDNELFILGVSYKYQEEISMALATLGARYVVCPDAVIKKYIDQFEVEDEEI